jgi:hypothetical protein
MTSERAVADRYPLTEAERAAFERDGWIRLPNFLHESELRAIESTYMALLRREIPVLGRDYCDMSGDYSRPIEDFGILNVMLPRRYHPALEDNVYERRASDVARQLCGDDMVLDYDQLVAKPPHKDEAVFHWHQDLGYWPITEDTRTASFWLALDDTRMDNGCLRFVRGSHRESELRPHLPLHEDRGKSHTLVATVDEAREPLDVAELRRGDVTVHHERAIHGSGGNSSDRWRRGYVVAFRSRATVAAERAIGFTHSHNDDVQVLNWIARQSER